jgi:hypothetical protein
VAGNSPPHLLFAFQGQSNQLRICHLRRHRPLQEYAKFTLIRLPLLASHPSVCAKQGEFWAHFAPKLSRAPGRPGATKLPGRHEDNLATVRGFV